MWPRRPRDDGGRDPRAARRAWEVIEDTGATATKPSLARAWTITAPAVTKRTQRPGFPPPISPGRWLTAEALATHPS